MYIEDREFIGNNFTEESLSIAEYEACQFLRCTFSNADLSHCSFDNCTFIDCDLSLCKLVQTSFRDTQFKGCKMLGLQFSNCKDFRFSVSFNSCTLDLSSFYKKQLKASRLIDCSLIDVDFTETDLSRAKFDNCNLSGAIFDNTNFTECDLRSAVNFSINPSNNKLSKTKFSKDGILGLVSHLSIIID